MKEESDFDPKKSFQEVSRNWNERLINQLEKEIEEGKPSYLAEDLVQIYMNMDTKELGWGLKLLEEFQRLRDERLKVTSLHPGYRRRYGDDIVYATAVA